MSDANTRRTPANRNPWYVLMTLYGEQDGAEIDPALHARNREAWNAWAGSVLPQTLRDECAARCVLLPDRYEFIPRGDEIRTRHRSEMLRRTVRISPAQAFPNHRGPG